MKAPSNRPARSAASWPLIVFAMSAILLLAVFIVISSRHPEPQAAGQSKPQVAQAITNSPAKPDTAATTPLSSPTANSLTNGTQSFQLKPFAVAYEGTVGQWTLADGKDTNVIRQLAHNSLEYDRMVEENPRIFRRQLVYLKETAAAVFEAAKLTGQPVHQLTLPGVDGQELQFEIIKSDSKSSSRQGMFSGHLTGNNDSMVTLAFEDGRQAFTILSPKENIFIVGEPREDGQVIVKAIDPNTYGVGPAEADDTVKTQPTNK